MLFLHIIFVPTVKKAGWRQFNEKASSLCPMFDFEKDEESVEMCSSKIIIMYICFIVVVIIIL